MKVIILAGGFGTRISEETHLKPKPMIEIGERPILWHIMKIYSHWGFNDFIICLGYKSSIVKQYFAQYDLNHADVTFDFRSGTVTIHHETTEPWSVTLVDTGMHTMTGGRIKRVAPYIGNQPFMLTYGDGLADIDLKALIEFHKSHGKLVTITAAQPLGRFGALTIDPQGAVSNFTEKPAGDGGWINGGFFVMQPEVLDYLSGDDCILEKEPLERLAAEGQLMAYKYHGFWHPMDTMRDKNFLENLWSSGRAPWKKW